MQQSLFPVDHLTVEPAPAKPEPEPTPEPQLATIPGQLDLFTGEEAA